MGQERQNSLNSKHTDIPSGTEGTHDADWVRASQQGSERAFAQLFERHSARLWHYANALSNGDIDEAQDLVQEAFVRAWKQLDTLREGAAFHAWLRTLLYRLAIDRRERLQHRQQLLEQYLYSPPGTDTPEERLLSRETGGAIAAAIEQLSQSSRAIFKAFHIEDKSIMEISEEMGLSVGAVKARLFQGRKNLRKELEDMAPEATLAQEIPAYLNIAIMGQCAGENDPLHPIRQTKSLLARRLLYFCRKSAKSAGELAQLLHADAAYIEDIIPNLIEGELLEEPFPGRYQTAFLFVGHRDYAPLEETLGNMQRGIAIIKRHLPALKSALGKTSLCGWQQYTWPELAWIAIPVWIVERGLGRQVASLPNWSKHRILNYPIRPVDFWYVKGDCSDNQRRTFRGSAMMTSSTDKGMGNVGEPRYIAGGDYHKTIRFEDLDRVVGRLSQGAISETDLLQGASAEERDSLVEYSQQGYLTQLPDGRWRLDMPVLTAADEEILLPIIDALCAELASDALDDTLTSFVDKIDELEFSHLLSQPHYLGYIGFHAACASLMVACRDEGLLSAPENPAKGFGCHAWYGASQIMQSWKKGR